MSRHGPGMDDNGYICLNMQGEFGRITELGTIREMRRNEYIRNEGIPDAEDTDAPVENESNGEDPPFA